jgi:hypothetical protein
MISRQYPYASGGDKTGYGFSQNNGKPSGDNEKN